MIGFSQFLIESKSAPLYHATDFSKAVAIISGNNLKAKKQGDYISNRTRGQTVIFVTRDIRHSYYWVEDSGGVIFQLDQLKLSQKYQIKPVKNWIGSNPKPIYMRGTSNRGDNEFEEVIITDQIHNLRDYIKKVIVVFDTDDTYHDDENEILLKLLKRYSIPYEEKFV